MESEKKFDVSIPRWSYWKKDLKVDLECPQCQSTLESESHVYTISVKVGEESDFLMTKNGGGYFCGECPVVALEEAVFQQSVTSSGYLASTLFLVNGIVDMDSIPEEKRNLPLGEDGNPIPLVEFVNAPTKENMEQHLQGKPIKNKNKEKALRKKSRKKK